MCAAVSWQTRNRAGFDAQGRGIVCAQGISHPDRNGVHSWWRSGNGSMDGAMDDGIDGARNGARAATTDAALLVVGLLSRYPARKRAAISRVASDRGVAYLGSVCRSASKCRGRTRRSIREAWSPRCCGAPFWTRRTCRRRVDARARAHARAHAAPTRAFTR